MMEDVKVEAFDEKWVSVGVYPSIKKAAQSLFIRYSHYIYTYLNGKESYTFKRQKRGITSYKDGKKYHFKKV